MYRARRALAHRKTESHIFSFNILQKPPYFISGTLSHRLAIIRHIRLHYVEPHHHSPNTEVDLKPRHRRLCAPCNFCYWLQSIKKSMSGLQTMFISLRYYRQSADEESSPLPSLKDAPIVQILSLKQSMSTKVTVETSLSMTNTMGNWHRYTAQFRKFEAKLKEKLDCGRKMKSRREPEDAIIDIPST